MSRDHQRASEPTTMSKSLRSQYLVHASPQTKIKVSLLAKAMADALGGPAEFRTRFGFKLVTEMIRNKTFGLDPGTWTDDTSMALCLARSIAKGVTKKVGKRVGGFDQIDQLNAYGMWWQAGYLSATGDCFDIGATVRTALGVYIEALKEGEPEEGLAKIKEQLSGEMCAGNGSLMRVLPVGLAYWRCEEGKDESEEGENGIWREYARRSSETTHPNPMCVEACELWVGAIVRIMRGNARGTSMTKLDLLQYFATFPYTSEVLKASLALSMPSPNSVDAAEVEEHYSRHHPILKLIVDTAKLPPSETNPLNLPTKKELPSSGYVLDTLVAALYCFFSTQTFKEGAITAVNLGNDADTIGAVYGGLAGCWYGSETDGEHFWSEAVKEWGQVLVKRSLVEQIAQELVEFDESRV